MTRACYCITIAGVCVGVAAFIIAVELLDGRTEIAWLV